MSRDHPALEQHLPRIVPIQRLPVLDTESESTKPPTDPSPDAQHQAAQRSGEVFASEAASRYSHLSSDDPAKANRKHPHETRRE